MYIISIIYISLFDINTVGLSTNHAGWIVSSIKLSHEQNWKFSKNVILYLERSRHLHFQSTIKNTHRLLVRGHACANLHFLTSFDKKLNSQKTSLNKYYYWGMCLSKKKKKDTPESHNLKVGILCGTFFPLFSLLNKVTLFFPFSCMNRCTTSVHIIEQHVHHTLLSTTWTSWNTTLTQTVTSKRSFKGLVEACTHESSCGCQWIRLKLDMDITQ